MVIKENCVAFPVFDHTHTIGIGQSMRENSCESERCIQSASLVPGLSPRFPECGTQSDQRSGAFSAVELEESGLRNQ